MSRNNDVRIYVGNLPPDVRSKDIDDLFYKFGRIVNIDLKNKRGPPFAFVEYEDSRDCEEAVRDRDGYDYDGYKLRVEFPRGPGSRRRDRRGPPSKRTDYRVVVSGLPSSGSWQDLKDHMRDAGEVSFADVYRDGTGVVEFTKYDDMRYAIKKLDDTKFRSHEGDSAYIRIREDTGRRSRSRSRSVSPRRRRSPSASPRRRRSPSASPRRRRSPSASPRRRRSTSASPRRRRSPSASPRRRRTPSNSPPRRSNSKSRSRSASRAKSKAHTPSRSRSRSPRN